MFSNNNSQDIFSAYRMYAGHKYVKALGGFEEYLATNPDSMSSLNMIGSIHFILGDKEKAENTYYKLVDKLVRKGEHDKALAVLTRMASFSKNKAKIFNLRYDIYRMKGKNRLANRQLLMLAEEYRHSGSFSDCIAIYTSLAEKNQTDYRLIRSLVHKLIIINGYSTISMILKNSVGNELFPVEEIDDIVMFLLESNVKPEYVIPFIKDFLSRHPDYFYKAEPVLIQSFRTDFNADLFSEIIDMIDISDASDFVQALREFLSDKELLLHSLLIEAYSDNRDMIKGMIFELYVNNSLDLDDIAEVSAKAENSYPLEEALKLVAKTAEESETVKCLGVMEKIYRSAGNAARADELAVYVKYGKTPGNIASFLASDPESAKDLELRFRQDDAAETEPEVIAEPLEIPAVELEIESHSYEDNTSRVAVEALELDTYNEPQTESKIEADILLNDDFDTAGSYQPSDIFEGFDSVEAPAVSSVFDGFDEPDTQESVSMELSDNDFIPAGQEQTAVATEETEALVFNDEELKNASGKEDEEDFFSKEVDG
ncbi:MAG: tetratricopeptide repeat protein [Deferribacterales bacterium]